MKPLAVVLILIVLSSQPCFGQEADARTAGKDMSRTEMLDAYPKWTVPQEKRIRLIISSDAANESDDQVVIAHALLSPTFIMCGLVAAHYRPHSSSHGGTAEATMEMSFDEMHALLKAMRVPHCVPIRRGGARAFNSASEPVHSEGADLIIEEAMRDHPRHLYVVVLGPMTDLAAAYLKEPRIAERLTAVWIGGAAYPDGGPEYNQDGDRIAAGVVMNSKLALWQIPKPVYRLPKFGMAEVAEKLGRQGDLGRLLFERINRFVTRFAPLTEFFQFSDAPAIGVLLQQPWIADVETKPAPGINLKSGRYVHGEDNREIRVYRSIDHRALLEDIFSKVAAFARNDIRPPCAGEISP